MEIMTREFNTFFEIAYFINLDGSVKRLEKFTENYEKSKLPWKLERFSAVNGSAIARPRWFQRDCGRGALGCYFSHLNIIQNAKEKGLKNVLIFEDDCVFSETALETMQSAVRQVPDDWDMLYLGAQYYHKRSKTKNVPFPFRISENIARCRNANRTHAYAVNQRAYDTIINHLLRGHHDGRASHVDHQYGILHENGDVNCYTVYPFVCYQDRGMSTITGRHTSLHTWEIYMSYDANKNYKISDFLVGYGNVGLDGKLGYENKTVKIDGIGEEYETLSVHAPSEGAVYFDNDVEILGAQNGDMNSFVSIEAKVDGAILGTIKNANSKTSSIVIKKGQHNLTFKPKGGKGGAHSVWCWKNAEPVVVKADEESQQNISVEPEQNDEMDEIDSAEEADNRDVINTDKEDKE